MAKDVYKVEVPKEDPARKYVREQPPVDVPWCDDDDSNDSDDE